MALSLSALSLAAIGPVTDLTIVNADVSPDGIERAAVLANGQFPGPLITGNKVCSLLVRILSGSCSRSSHYLGR